MLRIHKLVAWLSWVKFASGTNLDTTKVPPFVNKDKFPSHFPLPPSFPYPLLFAPFSTPPPPLHCTLPPPNTTLHCNIVSVLFGNWLNIGNHRVIDTCSIVDQICWTLRESQSERNENNLDQIFRDNYVIWVKRPPEDSR